MGRPLCRRHLKVSALKPDHGSGRASRGRRSLDVAQIAGRTKYEPITLERGVTHDTAFEQWANKVWHFGAGAGAEVSLKDFRKDITIDMFNEAGQMVLSYKVFRCWVSEYQALPDLDANANAVAMEKIKLENEGWERDTAVAEPAEPSYGS